METFRAHDSCPKCDCIDIGRQYCKGDYPCRVSHEHHHMHCRGCHYEWTEKCKDAGEREPG